jgi:hypothetical protein
MDVVIFMEEGERLVAIYLLELECFGDFVGELFELFA